MTVTDPASHDIAGLAGLIARREVSPVEVTNAFLDRIARLDGGLHAYVSVNPEQALAAARAAEREITAGQYRGPLHGVPLAIKDLFLVNGMVRTCGTAFLASGTDEPDATSVARLRAAGAVILGMLNLHELAYGPTGINPHHGTARNPWDPRRVAGGSSSGSACAVSAGLAAGALGTDTGGSIRIPAALCGVVGLKQTHGLASRHGIHPLVAGFDHGGPLARTVTDAAILLQAIAGEDPHDPTTTGVDVHDYSGMLTRGLTGIRVGVPERWFYDDLHPEVDTAVRAALTALESAGAHVERVELPFDAEAATQAWNTMGIAEAFATHKDLLAANRDRLSEDVAARLEQGRHISASDYLEASWCQSEVRRGMREVLGVFDLLALPTCPLPAVAVDGAEIRTGTRVYDGVRLLGRLTRLASFTGQPAISVPCGFTADGLPVGLQLLGRWFGEPALIGAARAYEESTGWHLRRPPLAATSDRFA